MTALLEVSNLNAFYDHVQVLRDISLSIDAGQITALLGANGAGKTTTIRAICGMVRTSGHIALSGEPIARQSTENIARRGVAHVPQGRGTLTRLTVEENLQLGAITRGDHRAILDDIEMIYARFPRLRERRRQQAGTLSGGEQQMLAIGRALMLRPKLMLLDEPSFGLAPLIVRELFDVLAEVNRSQGIAMMIVEQNAELALDIASQVYLLETGKIVISGDAEAIRQDDAVRRAYLGE